jgi:hypothetical protein
MSPSEPSGPDLDGVVAEARRLYDGKELTPEDIDDAHYLRVRTRHGIVDIMRGWRVAVDPISGADT